MYCFFLNGKDKIKLNLNNCYEVGKIIANIHVVTKKLKYLEKILWVLKS
jgi:homoserine kinase type II